MGELLRHIQPVLRSAAPGGPPYLGEEVDAVGDGVHGDGVSSDEEATEVHPGQAVEFGVQAGQLPDVVADHMQ